MPPSPASSNHRDATGRTTLLVTGAVAGLLLLALVAGIAWRRLAALPELELPRAGRLALLPVANATGEEENAWVEIGLMRMVADTLASTRGVEMVAPERLVTVLVHRGLDLSAAEARPVARRFAFALGAELVVDAEATRTATDADPSYALGWAVHDADRQVASGSFAGRDLVALGDQLAYALALELSGGRRPVPLAQAISPSPFLSRLYGMGLQELATAGAAAALPYFEICTRHQPGFLEARARLAEVLSELGEADRSRELQLTVLRQAQDRGERRLQARALTALGRLASAAGEAQEAEDLYGQAFSILLSLEDRGGQAEVLDLLTSAALERGQAARAEELLLERLTVARHLGDTLGHARTLSRLAELGLGRDDFEGARELLAEARELARAGEDLWLEMEVVVSLGKVVERQGDAAMAVAFWRPALAFFEQRGERRRQLELSMSLAEALQSLDAEEEAEELYLEVLDLATELEDRRLEALASLRLTRMMLSQGYPRQARRHLDRALELDRYIAERLTLQLMIAWYAYEQGNYRLAVDTQRAARRQAGEDSWGPRRQAFLEVFERALAEGRRLPLPGEKGYSESGP